MNACSFFGQSFGRIRARVLFVIRVAAFSVLFVHADGACCLRFYVAVLLLHEAALRGGIVGKGMVKWMRFYSNKTGLKTQLLRKVVFTRYSE